MELIGYGGYKFVGVVVTILFSFLNLGRWATASVFLYTFSAQAFFLVSWGGDDGFRFDPALFLSLRGAAC